MAKLGVQQSEVAESVGVEPSAVTHWLNGSNLAAGKNLRKLATLLRCDPGWLSGGEEDRLSEGGEPGVKDQAHAYLERVLNSRDDWTWQAYVLHTLKERFPLANSGAGERDISDIAALGGKLAVERIVRERQSGAGTSEHKSGQDDSVQRERGERHGNEGRGPHGEKHGGA